MTTPANERSTNLIWIDLEMTGLCTANDTIVEIATIVTDKYLNELAEGPVLAINQSQETMDGMDEWNTRQHGNSGLTARVLESETKVAEAEAATLAFPRCVETVFARIAVFSRARCPNSRPSSTTEIWTSVR